MIRAVFRDGAIHPLDPVPEGWKDGAEIRLEEVKTSTDQESEKLEQWYHEMQATVADLDRSEEWAEIEQTLHEADRCAKDQVRREMGLTS